MAWQLTNFDAQQAPVVTMTTIAMATWRDASRYVMDRCRRHCGLHTYTRDISQWFVLVRTVYSAAVDIIIAHERCNLPFMFQLTIDSQQLSTSTWSLFPLRWLITVYCLACTYLPYATLWIIHTYIYLWPLDEWSKTRRAFFLLSYPFYRASTYAGAVLAVVILSVCPSVCLSHVCTSLWQKQTMHCRYFDTTRKGNHSSFPTPTVWNLRSKWPTPFEKRRLRQISAYNVSTAKDSEKKFNYDEQEVDHGLSSEL